MKTSWTFEWAIAALLLIGAIAGTTSAPGQKSPGNPSGTDLWLTAMDTDRDGTVSKQEFTAYMEAQFDKADADHDGTLDRNEMKQLRKILGMTTASAQKTSTAPSSATKLSITALDKDNDGTVSKQEFRAYMESQFDKADADRDGTLNRNELEQLRRNLGIEAK